MLKIPKLTVAVLLVVLTCLFSSGARAEDPIETAGIATGVTIGNTVLLPAKAVSVTFGLLNGVLSLLLAGNMDLAKQTWQDTTSGPYVIDLDVAKKAVGDRPELRENK